MYSSGPSSYTDWFPAAFIDHRSGQFPGIETKYSEILS